MTASEFSEARQSLGLTQAGLSVILGVDIRSVKRWEAKPETKGSREPNPIACQVLRWMAKPGRPKEWPGK